MRAVWPLVINLTAHVMASNSNREWWLKYFRVYLHHAASVVVKHLLTTTTRWPLEPVCVALSCCQTEKIILLRQQHGPVVIDYSRFWTGLKLENYYFFTFLLFLDLKLENYSLFTFLLFLDLKLEYYSVFTFLLFLDLQDCSNSSELAMELLQSCTKPSKYGMIFQLEVEKK